MQPKMVRSLILKILTICGAGVSEAMWLMKLACVTISVLGDAINLGEPLGGEDFVLRLKRSSSARPYFPG